MRGGQFNFSAENARTTLQVVRPTPNQSRNKILWDAWGIPHIYAKEATRLFHGFGWAQAQSHGNLILRLHGQARGRAAKYWRGDYLDSDRWVRAMGIPRRAEEWYQAQSPEFGNYLDAFAEGINYYGTNYPGQISDDVKISRCGFTLSSQHCQTYTAHTKTGGHDFGLQP